MIEPLQPPDSHHLLAAEGWLELGDHVAADQELDRITRHLRNHPDVLELRWQIYAKAKEWEASIDIANAIIKLAPEIPIGWIHRSFALHELKRTEAARDYLLPALACFPANATMRYNLACYESQLGNLKLAFAYLEKAFDLEDSKQLRIQAVDDPDLKPVWEAMGDSLRGWISLPKGDQPPQAPEE